MSKKPISQKKAEREQLENQALHRIFNVFLLGLAAECYLFIVYRGCASSSIDSMLLWYQSILPAAMWLGLAMLVGGAIAGYVKRQDSRVRGPMIWVGGIGLFLAVSSWIMTTFSNDHRGITTMCILVPIVAVLGLVYLLFQPECFLGTLVLSGAMFAVWVRGASAHSGSWRIPTIAALVLVCVVIAAIAWLTRQAQQSEGKLKGLRIYSTECDYRIVYAALAASAGCVLLALILPAIAYYLLWVLGILLFAELVLYTTKLM